MIDWGMIISAVLGLVGGGALTGFMLRKQTEGSATAGVVKESMDALKSALETLTSQQEVFAITIKSKDDAIVSRCQSCVAFLLPFARSPQHASSAV